MGRLLNLGAKIDHPGNVGTRIPFGRMGTFDNTTPKTFAMTLVLEGQYDAVRLVLANNQTGNTVAIGKACAVRKPNLSAPNISSSTLFNFTFAGSAGGTIPVAPGANRRSFLFSDWLVIPSVPRDDAGIGSIITLAAYSSTAGNIGVVGNGTDSFTNWATKPDGRCVLMRYNDGDCITTPANFTSTTNRSQSLIFGLQYMSRGRIINAVGFGDSISEGRGTYLGAGWGHEACVGLSNGASGVAVEWSNLGWSGLSSPDFGAVALDALAAFSDQPWDLAFIPNYSPNNGGASPTNSADGSSQIGASWATRIAGECRRFGTEPVIWTGLPTDPAVYDINAADSYRRDLNTESLNTWAARLLNVVDFSAAVSGAIDGDGQTNFAVGATTDHIHPNDTGNTAIAAVAKRVIQRLAPLPLAA